MNHKEFTLLEATSKSATFSTEVVDTTRDELFGCALTTTSAAALNVSMQLEASFEETNWFSVGSAVAVTTDTTTPFTITDNPYPFVRVTLTFSGGAATFTISGHTKSY